MNQSLQRPANGGARDLADLLKGKQQAMARLAGDVLDVERLTSLALVATRKVPQLLQCSQESILQACMDAARLGLEPDGVQAAIIPYGREAQLVPMYRGLIALAYREPVLQSVSVTTVYDCDYFDLQYGTEARIVHRPAFDRDDKAKAIAWYCVTKTRGEPAFDVMFPVDIERIRARGPKRKGPWDTDYDEMAKKTVLKRRLKKVPASARLRSAVEHDDVVESSEVSVAEKATTTKRADKLAKALTGNEEPPENTEPPADDGPPEPPGLMDEPPAAKSMVDFARRLPHDKAGATPILLEAKKALSTDDYKSLQLVARMRVDEPLMDGERDMLKAILLDVTAAGGFLTA